MRVFHYSVSRCVLGILALALILTILVWPRAARAQAASPQAWVLHNVNVVDTRTGRIAPRSAILIDGGRIVRVGPSRSLRAPGVRRVDGRGAYVVPGLNDMHAHPLNDPDPRANLNLMLANGITGFRQMSGSTAQLEARREGRFTWPNAPQLLGMPGDILTPANALFPPSAIATIQAQQAAGADFIKAVIMPPPTFMAMLAEARRIGIPVSGHLPDGIDVRQAAQGGMTSLEHYGGGQDSFLLSCSREEERLRAEAAAEARSGPAINLDLNDQAALVRILTNPVLARAQRGYARTRQVVATYDEERCRAVARLLAEHRFWQAPTLIRIRTMQVTDDPAYRNDPNLRYVSPATRALWTELGDAFPQQLSAEDRAGLAQLFALQLRLTRLLDEAGVPMLAGSDFGGQWLVAGFSLHQEFDLLAEAGLSPLKILQMTTLNAGTFLRRAERMGTVEAGRDADLVLLAANPIASHRNLRRITAVVRGGTYHSRQALDAMMAAAAEAVRNGPAVADNHGH